jgi:lipid A 3-O-deacylase
MLKRIAPLALGGLLMAQLLPAQAAGFGIAAGETDDNAKVFRVSGQQAFSQRWFEGSAGHLGGYWDAGYSYWEAGQGDSANHSLSLAPVFVWEFPGESVRPVIEAAIGAALFVNTRVDGNRLGSAFQFEDRLGAGLRFGHCEVGVRALHYSNAGMQTPNDGVNNMSLYYQQAL